MWRLESADGRRVVLDAGARSRDLSLAGVARREARERQTPQVEAREDGRADESRRARKHFDAYAARAREAHELVPRVGDAWRAGVGHDGDERLSRALHDAQARGVGRVGLVRRERFAGDLVGGEQPPRDPRIFGHDEVGQTQRVERAEGDVAKIPQRRRNQRQRHEATDSPRNAARPTDLGEPRDPRTEGRFIS